MSFWDEKKANEILEYSFSINVRWLVVICVFIGVIIACFVKYFKDKSKMEIKINELEKLNKVLDEAVNKFEDLESIQAYQYSIKNDSNFKYIKMQYLFGEADERIEINSILQTYFYFPYSIFKKIRNISNSYDQLQHAKETGDIESINSILTKESADLCTQLIDILDQIDDADNIDMCSCEYYRVVITLLSCILKKPVENILKNEKVENALIQRKKTGLIGSVLLQGLYIFKNESSVCKRDRIYFSFPYNKEKNIILLASINANVSSETTTDSIEKYCTNTMKYILAGCINN